MTVTLGTDMSLPPQATAQWADQRIKREGSPRGTKGSNPSPSSGESHTNSSDSLYLDGAEITVVEEIADQPARARGDDDRVRFGQGLQTGGEVRRFTDDRSFLRRSCANQIADDHHARWRGLITLTFPMLVAVRQPTTPIIPMEQPLLSPSPNPNHPI
jgi:hypothetical protein